MSEILELGKTERKEIFLRVVLYGEAGAGKTHLLREFPKPMIIYDFDQKFEPLIGIEGIEVRSYTVTDPSPGDYDRLRKEFWQDWRDDQKKDYATRVVDSLTNLDNLLIKAFMESNQKPADGKVTLPIFGDLKNFYSTLFNSMRGLAQKSHVIVIAHEKFHTNDEGNVLAIKPLITGGMKDEITALFKDTWYLEYKNSGGKEERILHYKKFQKRVCASTTLRGEGMIVNPTFEKIRQETLNKE